jgi:hypothetical protein
MKKQLLGLKFMYVGLCLLIVRLSVNGLYSKNVLEDGMKEIVFQMLRCLFHIDKWDEMIFVTQSSM